MSATKKDIKEEVKDIVQEEVKQEPTAVSESVRILSNQDTAVSDLVAEAPSSIESISAREGDQFNLLELPEECYPLHKVKYRFRWIAKGPHTSARIRSSVWELCTKLNAPFIKPHRFKSHGAVEQAGMLLAFCSEKVGKEREEAPAKKSAALVKHYTEDLPQDEARGFYKPKDTGESNDGDGLIEGKDF